VRAVPSGRAAGRSRGCRVAAWLAVMAVLAAGGVAAWRTGASHPNGPAGLVPGSALPPATAPVVLRDLSETTAVNATLGYAGSYTVTGKGAGTLTWLPSAGQVIRQGQALYRVDNSAPVALLYGAVPAWRALSEGDAGADVAQLNHDLVSLGYAASADISSLSWDYYSWETAYGVERLEASLGVSSPPGSLPLGSVVFEPGPVRVTSVTPALGANVTPGPVLGVTSTAAQVTIELSAAQQSSVKVGDAVTITLPDNRTTPGVVRSVGTVAKTPSNKGGEAGNGGGGNGGGGEEGGPTIEVDVAPSEPRAIVDLDEAPVTVSITTASVADALVVPVDALLALAGASAANSGGYAVEVAEGRSHRLLAVSLGLFDDAEGLVQVSGAGLSAGQRVVVPAT
jgi:hypothetical protein